MEFLRFSQACQQLAPGQEVRLLLSFARELTVEGRAAYDGATEAASLRWINELQHRVLARVASLHLVGEENFPGGSLFIVLQELCVSEEQRRGLDATAGRALERMQ